MASLGESARQALFWHMEHAFGVKREDIPKNPEKFQESLESLFGSGANILVRSIETEISSGFKIPNRWQNLGEAVRKAMKGSGWE